MAMKTILVPIPDTAVDTAAIEIALMVAKAVTGHVEGLYIETPASITLRTGRLGGYEATREVGLAQGAQRAQEEFARAAEARERAAVAESRADVIRYLGWHGITATARQVKPLSRNIGDTLLHEASEAGIGMLVMGAYSHSRVRELLLGGVTRYVLSSVAVTPVFMAH
jgi:nucleotide-binding universal stress UspA family protein